MSTGARRVDGHHGRASAGDRCSAASRSMSPVPGSQSTSTGVAPACSMALADATNVIDGTSTSSPGPCRGRAARGSAPPCTTPRRRAGRRLVARPRARTGDLRTGPNPARAQRSTTSSISASSIRGLPKTRNDSLVGRSSSASAVGLMPPRLRRSGRAPTRCAPGCGARARSAEAARDRLLESLHGSRTALAVPTAHASTVRIGDDDASLVPADERQVVVVGHDGGDTDPAAPR